MAQTSWSVATIRQTVVGIFMDFYRILRPAWGQYSWAAHGDHRYAVTDAIESVKPVAHRALSGQTAI